MANNHIEVHKGEVFGRLTVMHISKGAMSGDHVKYFCKCECGNTTEAASSHLRRKMTVSCGCLRDERIKKLGIKSRKQLKVGDHFGEYSVVKDLGTNKHRKAIYKVKCSCSYETVMTGARLRSGLKLHCFHIDSI